MREPKILLVDDVDYSRQLLRNNIMALTHSRLLQHNTFNFFNAGTASAAVSLFNQQRPDLVFLDIELPDSSGLELLSRFKQERPDCFISMISGQSTLQNVQQSIAKGAATFIVKPFSGDKILAAMRLFEKRLTVRPIALDTP
ncbi:response regulator [Rheinheimera nanhaiensis]|uniref:Two-component system, chemotaxis family, response regulator CheY n=1 Tax=Rheinheimera nanhaiensis E407-8 TaxID=562729 RepID=I1DZ58_9GAMM|nr:response regulator [Rheinheimera nanhaiensis]GAB59336.1 two-component system, chemotaxis family, response regulator CheY [Rheinheimera nanhaiensis E407-8]